MKLKKIAALFFTAVLVLSLCACSDNKEENAPGTDTTATEAPASEVTEKTTEAVTDAPADAVTEVPTEAPTEAPAPKETVVTDMIGREVTVIPGSYKRVVCIGAGALRMYSYIGNTALLCGVEDIDNESLADRPKMFDAAPRPYVLAFGDVFSTLDRKSVV